MGAAGIIVEYNPLHSGHLRLLEAGRAALGPDTAMVCVMSGNFVQRGDFALLRKHARARAAVESGADLVLELPLPWAVSSAEGFAAGGVQALAATGVVEHLLFGSECGDVSALERVAAALLAPSFRDRLREVLPGAVSFAAARQRALTGLLPEEDAAAFADAIVGAKAAIHCCPVCQNFSEGDGLCPVCQDPKRDTSVICVVADPKDVVAMERSREYPGLYHVLHGVISPMNHVGPDDIRVKELVDRVAKGDVREVIMATNPDTEGEATAMYLSRLLKPFQVRVTRLAYGIPVGSHLEYADDATLMRALEGRREM